MSVTKSTPVAKPTANLTQVPSEATLGIRKRVEAKFSEPTVSSCHIEHGRVTSNMSEDFLYFNNFPQQRNPRLESIAYHKLNLGKKDYPVTQISFGVLLKKSNNLEAGIYLLDGQNRLTAVKELDTKTGVEFNLCFQLYSNEKALRAAYTNFDGGGVRTPLEVAKAVELESWKESGETNKAFMLQTSSYISTMAQGFFANGHRTPDYINSGLSTTLSRLNCVRNHWYDAIKWYYTATSSQDKYKTKKLWMTQVASVFIAAYYYQPDKASTFLEAVLSKDEVTNRSPVKLVRDFITSANSLPRDGASRKNLSISMSRYWNSYYKGITVGKSTPIPKLGEAIILEGTAFDGAISYTDIVKNPSKYKIAEKA